MYLTGTEKCSLRRYIILQKKPGDIRNVCFRGVRSASTQLQDGTGGGALRTQAGEECFPSRESRLSPPSAFSREKVQFSPLRSLTFGIYWHNNFLKIASFLHQNLSWSLGNMWSLTHWITQGKRS